MSAGSGPVARPGSVGLRTVSLGEPLAPAPVIVEPSPAEDVFVDDDIVEAPVVAAASAPTSRRGAHAAPGIRATGVWLVVVDEHVFGRRGLDDHRSGCERLAEADGAQADRLVEG